MNNIEILTKLIQESVDGCAENWARKISEYLTEHGTYVPDKKPIHIIPEYRLTDSRMLSGWYQPMNHEEIQEMLNSLPPIREVYARLGEYENLAEDGMLMAFMPIRTDEAEL